MILFKDIRDEVYKMLEFFISRGDTEVGFDRIDYGKNGIIIVDLAIDGEGSLRFGRINVNVHVKDKIFANKGKTINIADRNKLDDMSKAVIDVLKRHYNGNQGYNWYIGNISSPMAEQGQNEHIISIPLEIVIRERKN